MSYEKERAAEMIADFKKSGCRGANELFTFALYANVPVLRELIIMYHETFNDLSEFLIRCAAFFMETEYNTRNTRMIRILNKRGVLSSTQTVCPVCKGTSGQHCYHCRGTQVRSIHKYIGAIYTGP